MPRFQTWWRLISEKAGPTQNNCLESFLGELLKDDIHILEILESESNREELRDKFNRVDLKVKNQKNEIIIIEVQYEREFDYLQRILFGASKAITEHLHESDPYSKVVKVISVNILYFDLGQGEDYVYHGSTTFKGLHHKDVLQLSEDQRELYGKNKIFEIFPEYYLIKVNNFDDIAKDTLDEWIYFLKNEEIKEGFKARGLKKAKKELDILKLPEHERIEYERYKDDLHYQASMVESSFKIGLLKGKKEGKKEGRKKGRKKRRKKRKRRGNSNQTYIQGRYGCTNGFRRNRIDNGGNRRIETEFLRKPLRKSRFYQP